MQTNTTQNSTIVAELHVSITDDGKFSMTQHGDLQRIIDMMQAAINIKAKRATPAD